MTNLPPPDPRSSRLGFDELVGVIVAFSVIGVILFVSLRPKDRGFKLINQRPVVVAPQADPNAIASPIPTTVPTQPIATPLPQQPEVVQATPLAPVTPTRPVPRVTPLAPVVPVPVPVPVQPVEASPSPTPVPTVSFSDVPQDFWARPYIEALAGRGIIVGYQDGTFRPNQPVTRAEFAAQLANAFEQNAVSNAVNYQDVPSDFWAASAIQEMTRSGFLRGYPRNVFRPTQQIPKVQALVALSQGLGLTPPTTPAQVLQVYQDAGQIPQYAISSVAAATQAGLVVNHPNPQVLAPNKITTRAEVAALVYQALVQTGKMPDIESEYKVNPPQQ